MVLLFRVRFILTLLSLNRNFSLSSWQRILNIISEDLNYWLHVWYFISMFISVFRLWSVQVIVTHPSIVQWRICLCRFGAGSLHNPTMWGQNKTRCIMGCFNCTRTRGGQLDRNPIEALRLQERSQLSLDTVSVLVCKDVRVLLSQVTFTKSQKETQLQETKT